MTKIGYITKQDPKDKKAYSGTHFNMMKALQTQFHHVVPLGPVDTFYKHIPKVKGRIYRLFSNNNYKYQYDIKLAKRAAALIDKKVDVAKPDVLLASLMSPEVAYLKTKVPLYVTTDATFPLLNDVYGSHSNLHPKSIKEALHLEEQAFKKATKLILPLKWLADSAMSDYGIPSKKIEVVPYGSNLELEVSNEELNRLIEARSKSETIKLLFVGVRWEEKGGPYAIEVLKSLLKMGVKAELQVVGCTPEVFDKPDELKILGFLDKENAEDSKRLHQLYKEANFFILPTKAECVGMSFIEAASVGLPAIGSDVGGVPEAIQHEKTGFICNKNQTPEQIAEWIAQTCTDKDQYRNLSTQAYLNQQNKMNWQNWGKRIKEIINNDIYN